MDSDADAWTFSKMHNLLLSMQRNQWLLHVQKTDVILVINMLFKSLTNFFLLLFYSLCMCWAMKIEDMTPEEEVFSLTVDLFASIVMSYNWFVPTI